jgi:hypothetical protein
VFFDTTAAFAPCCVWMRMYAFVLWLILRISVYHGACTQITSFLSGRTMVLYRRPGKTVDITPNLLAMHARNQVFAFLFD